MICGIVAATFANRRDRLCLGPSDPGTIADWEGSVKWIVEVVLRVEKEWVEKGVDVRALMENPTVGV